MAKLVDSPSFTIPVAKFIKQEAEKTFYDKSEMEKRFKKLVRKVENKKIKV